MSEMSLYQSSIMNTQRVFAVGLALVLQLLPLTRISALQQALTSGNSVLAILFRMSTATAALLGPIHAVSGASTLISSALTASGTNGVAFNYRITTRPDPANVFSAVPLPAGLVISKTTGKITGTPTVDGVFSVKLTASDNGRADRTISSFLTLTIKPKAGVVSPSITAGPQSLVVVQGSAARFEVAAAGGAPLSYQWLLNGRDLSGQTSSVLTLSGVGAGDEGSYTVRVTNSAGSVTSSAAQLQVLVRPLITTLSSAPTITEGDPLTLAVSATGSVPMAFQWKKDGVILPGATGEGFTISKAAVVDSGTYTVSISNGAGEVISQGVPVVVKPVVLFPVVIENLIYSSGTFRFTASGPDSGVLTVWVSTDLVTWRALDPQSVVAGGTLVTDAAAVGGGEQRFYRVSYVR